MQDMHSGKVMTLKTVKRSVFASGWGPRGEMNRRAHRIFRAVKRLRRTPGWRIPIIKHFAKLIQHTTLRLNFNVNYKLWLIKTCQCWFVSANNCTTLLGILITGKHAGMQGHMGNHDFVALNNYSKK